MKRLIESYRYGTVKCDIYSSYFNYRVKYGLLKSNVA